MSSFTNPPHTRAELQHIVLRKPNTDTPLATASYTSTNKLFPIIETCVQVTMCRINIDWTEKPMYIVVGHKREEFYVRPSVLCQNSPFLKGACEQVAQAGCNYRGLKLLNFDADLFDLYLQWLSGNSCALKLRGDIPSGQIMLARCYIMGRALQDTLFLDCVLDRISRVFAGYAPCLCAVNIIYNETSLHSPARRLMVDLYEISGGKASLSGYHPGFRLDVTGSKIKHRYSFWNFVGTTLLKIVS